MSGDRLLLDRGLSPGLYPEEDLWPGWLHVWAAYQVKHSNAPHRVDLSTGAVRTVRWAGLVATLATEGTRQLLNACAGDPSWADAVLAAEALAGDCRWAVHVLAQQALTERGWS